MTKAFIVLLVFRAIGSELPEDFVSLEKLDPSIVQEIRYAGFHNFVGRPLPGYRSGKCILSRKTAERLVLVQKELKAKALSLKVYDCYRPTRAVAAFLDWSKNPNDITMKEEFYPHIDKTRLFPDGYIAAKSVHSRGSAVDLTIVPVPTPQQEVYKRGDTLKGCILPRNQRFADNSLDMGTGYDCFDDLAHPGDSKIVGPQAENRKMLRELMEKNGFVGVTTEWWHFNLKDDPHPNDSFDFEIK